jgi:hypothetical protein
MVRHRRSFVIVYEAGDCQVLRRESRTFDYRYSAWFSFWLSVRCQRADFSVSWINFSKAISIAFSPGLPTHL